jgi:hypothetical protein
MLKIGAFLCLVPLGVSACSFTIGIRRESRAASSSPAPLPSNDLAALVAEYEAELLKYCNAQLVARESCAEQQRLILAFRQSADKRRAFQAWNDHASELEHPFARRPLLAILARIGLALER